MVLYFNPLFSIFKLPHSGNEHLHCGIKEHFLGSALKNGYIITL